MALSDWTTIQNGEYKVYFKAPPKTLVDSMENVKKEGIENNPKIVHVKYLRRLVSESSKKGPSKNLGLVINERAIDDLLHSDYRRSRSAAQELFSVPIAFRYNEVYYYEDNAIQVENNHHTTCQQIERILLHVVCSTPFQTIIVRHNRYVFDFGKINPKLLQLLITNILDCKSKRINYSWIAPLQEVIINYELDRVKKKKSKKLLPSERLAQDLMDDVPSFPGEPPRRARPSYLPPQKRKIVASKPIVTGHPDELISTVRRIKSESYITSIAAKSPNYSDFINALENVILQERSKIEEEFKGFTKGAKGFGTAGSGTITPGTIFANPYNTETTTSTVSSITTTQPVPSEPLGSDWIDMDDELAEEPQF